MFNLKRGNKENLITVCSHGAVHIHLGQTSIHMSGEEFASFSRLIQEMAVQMKKGTMHGRMPSVGEEFKH